MIEIKEMPNNDIMILSPVSDFTDSMGYCEFRIKHFLKGMKAPQTKVTIEGTESHDKEVEYEREHFTFVPISQDELEDIDKDIELARERVYTRFLTKMKYGNKNLSILIFGQADKILRSKGTLVVEESKFPDNTQKYLGKFEPYEDQTLQTLLYLNSRFSENGSLDPKEWFKIPHKEKMWIVNIKDKKTSKSVIIFKGIQTNKTKKFLKAKIEKFALVVLGNSKPEHHKNIRKCLKCRFLDSCQYKIC